MMDHYDERYEVRQRDIERMLKDMGARIAEPLPEGWGYMLFLFSFGEGGSTFYISNAQRETIIEAMEEWIARERKKT